jgi:hypothetical protein
MEKTRISKLAQQINQIVSVEAADHSNQMPTRELGGANKHDKETPEMREKRRVAIQKLKTFLKD